MKNYPLYIISCLLCIAPIKATQQVNPGLKKKYVTKKQQQRIKAYLAKNDVEGITFAQCCKDIKQGKVSEKKIQGIKTVVEKYQEISFKLIYDPNIESIRSNSHSTNLILNLNTGPKGTVTGTQIDYSHCINMHTTYQKNGDNEAKITLRQLLINLKNKWKELEDTWKESNETTKTKEGKSTNALIYKSPSPS